MKFDGKQIKVKQDANLVRAPKTQNKNLVPIIVVVILALVLIGVSVYIFFFSGLFKKQISISFDKPVAWGDTVYALYYKDTNDLKQRNESVLKDEKKKDDYKMTSNSVGEYSIKIDDKYKDGYVIFFDNKNNAYPEDALLKIATGQLGGEKIVNGKKYAPPKAEEQTSQTSQTSKATSETSK